MVKLVLCLILFVVGVNCRNIEPAQDTLIDEEYSEEDIPYDVPSEVNAEIVPTSGCTIAINGGDLPEPQPLLIYPNTLSFVNPDRNGIITMAENQQIELYCSGSFVAPFTNTRTLFATCQGGNFLVNGASSAFEEPLSDQPSYKRSCPPSQEEIFRKTKYEWGQVDVDLFIKKLMQDGINDVKIEQSGGGTTKIRILSDDTLITISENSTHIYSNGKEKLRLKLRDLLLKCVPNF